jgi:RES domain-containing protein
VPPPRLPRTLVAYRIGDPDGEYSLFDAIGSTIMPGRWNHSWTPVLYAAEHYSTAMLEKLVKANPRLPPNQHYIEITLPRGLSYEIVTQDILPGWAAKDPLVAQDFGATWVLEKRSAILLVPSIVARIEHNILINPAHSEFNDISYGLAYPVWWDERLFG